MGFWASFGSAASSALGSAVGGSFGSLGDMVTGGYFTRKGQSQQNRYNLYSTGTAHQREVNDLRMAGLNPVLSAIGNGAAVLPVHGVNTPKTDFSGVMQKAVDHGIQTYNARTQRELANQQQELLASQSENTKAQTAKSKAEAELAEAEADYVRRQGTDAFRKKYEPSGISHTSWIFDNVFKPVSDWTGEKIGKPLHQFLEGEGGRNSASSIEHDINAIRLRQYEMLKPWMFYHEGKRYWKFPDGHATSDFERAADLIPKYWKDLQKEKR